MLGSVATHISDCLPQLSSDLLFAVQHFPEPNCVFNVGPLMFGFDIKAIEDWYRDKIPYPIL